MGASLVYLENPNKEIEFEEGENNKIKYVAASMQGWRINMEDTHISMLDYNKDNKLSLFGVFDGHGGKEVAIFTKQHIGNCIKQSENFKQGKFDLALRDSFLKIDEDLCKDWGREEIANMKRKNPPNKSPLLKTLVDAFGNGGGGGNPSEQTNEQLMLDSIGCTANVIAIEDYKKLYIANAGDSRSVLARGGKAFALSTDHKPHNEIEKARIEKAGSTITDEGRVDGNLNLSRSLGDLKYKQNKNLKPEEHPVTANPDLQIVDITPEDDFIIIGCDGVWETKDNQEMVDFIYDRIKEGKDAKIIIRELLEDIISPDYVKTNGVGCDNMTCIIVQFKKE